MSQVLIAVALLLIFYIAGQFFLGTQKFYQDRNEQPITSSHRSHNMSRFNDLFEEDEA